MKSSFSNVYSWIKLYLKTTKQKKDYIDMLRSKDRHCMTAYNLQFQFEKRFNVNFNIKTARCQQKHNIGYSNIQKVQAG